LAPRQIQRHRRLAPVADLLVRRQWFTRSLRLVILLALFTGCRNPTPLPVTDNGPQANLVRRIADADRVVLTNRWASRSEPQSNFTVCIGGRKVDGVVRAIASARPLVGVSTRCMYSWQLQFFNRTNYLGQVRFQGEFLLDQQTEYEDGTGTLQKLYDKLVSQTRRRELRLQGRL
jgi:hypothetical protein